MRPREALSEITSRMLDSEASIGEKVMLIECLSNAAVRLSNIKEKQSAIIEKFKEQQEKDNQFFGIKSIFDEEIQQVGTVIR